jgi:hypothetical protein
VPEASVLQEPPRSQFVLIGDQNPAWQDTQRTFQNTHVLIQYQRPEPGALKQSHHRRDEDSIIGSDEFTHGFVVFVGPSLGMAIQPTNDARVKLTSYDDLTDLPR